MKYANDVCGPLIYKGRLYLLCDSKRTLACLDLNNGKVIWIEKFKSTGEFRGSPTGADGKVYFMSMAGEVFVVEAGDKYKLLSKIEMNERNCFSTISAAGGRLFLRTPRYLYCLTATGK